MIMDERQTMHAMMLDDAYCVERVLADGRIRRHRNGEPRWSRAVRTQEDAAAAGEAARIAISLILRDEKGNFVFWRSEYVRKPAKGESRAFSIQIYGLPKYASYEAYVYAS